MYCAVCGYENDEPPWGASGHLASFEICPCCGVEAGYTDFTDRAADAFRARWLAAGAPWADRYTSHDDLDTATRLANVRPDLARGLTD